MIRKGIIISILSGLLPVSVFSCDIPVAIEPVFAPIENKGQCVTSAKDITINKTPDVSCTHITAQHKISLKPGFTFKAGTGYDFTGKIDQGLLFAPTHGQTKNPDETLNDDNSGYAVGSIPYEYSVTESGAAQYNIPIECPVGINGMEPKISLVYNSQAGDGIMGWGWSIGGLSSIVRVNKNHYFDGTAESISFTSDDALALDGQRLLKYEENYYGETLYKTESDNFCRIVAYDIQPWGPKFFKVYTKEGLIMTYGSVDGDISGYYILRKAGDHIYNLAWHLTKIEDSNGNKIVYKYSNNYLAEIVYGKNTGTGVGFETIISFRYDQPISKPVPKYVSGQKVSIDKCLSSVHVINGGSEKGVYSINYTTSENKNYITEIGFQKNGVKIGSTKFKWQKNEYKYTNEGLLRMPVKRKGGKYTPIKSTDITCDGGVFECQNGEVCSSMSGDIDGDGLSDLLVVFYEDNCWKKYQYVLLHNIGSKYNVVYNSISSDKPTSYFSDNDNDGSDELYVAFSKEGRIQLDQIKWNKQNKYCEEKKLYKEIKHTGAKDHISPIMGDFYGNMTVQIIPIKNTDEISFYQSADAPAIDNIPHFPPNSKIFVTDINGNGKSELTIVTTSGETYVYEEKNRKFQPIINGTKYDFGSSENIYQGDFNGDGNTDFLVHKDRWAMYFSNGKGFVKLENSLPLSSSRYEYESVFVADINGDGRSDLITKYEYFYGPMHEMGYMECYREPWYTIGKQYGRVLISTGVNFEEVLQFENGADLWGVEASGFIKDKNKELYVSGGNWFNKTNITDLTLHSFSNSDGYNKIVSATDGMEKRLILTYGKMVNSTNDKPLYHPTGEYLGDVTTLSRCQWDVVTSALLTTETCRISSYDYKYEKAQFDKSGKGFLGYLTTSVTNNTTGTTTKTENELNSSYKFMFPRKQIVTQGGKLIKETYYEDYTLDHNRAGKYGGYSFLPKKIVETDYLSGIKTETRYPAYDGYGNVQKKVVKQGDLTITEDYFEYYNDWTSKPERIQITRTYKGKDKVDNRVIGYDLKGNIISDDDGNVRTTYTDYDVFGHAQTIKHTADGQERVEKTTYVPCGRYIASKTNINGETTTYKWHEGNGTLFSETDHYGRTTSHSYDRLGRRVETKFSDGTRNVCSLLWAEKDNPMGAAYYEYSETSGKSPTYKWYTSDGRLVCSQEYGFGGRLISVFTEYNVESPYMTIRGWNFPEYETGTVKRVSEPTFSTSAEKWQKEYTYDAYRRPVKISTPTGETKISYDGLSTTTTTPTGTTTVTLSAEGWKESVATNGKSVKYEYYPTGLVKSATPDGGATVSLEYDNQGRRTKLIDPDGGTVKETYNSFGDITSSEREIAEGRKVRTTYTYNDKCQLVQTNINGDIIRYTYDGNNRLQKKELGGTHSVRYEYDDYDRIVSTTEKIEGREFKHSVSYDRFGRVREETFPTGYSVTNRYDDYGFLTSQTDNKGNYIYSVLSSDAKGRVLTESRNGKKTNYTYDGKDNLTDIEADGVLNLQYAYRKNNNLPYSVSDKIAGFRQEYYYDNQNRLTSWPIFTLNGGTPIQTNTLKYDGNNNITDRSAFGKCAIEYKNSEHPHAVSGIDGVPDVIPRTDLNITYTDFCKVESMEEGDNRYSITYGTDQDRIKSVLRTKSGETTRYYLADYEEVVTPLGKTEKYHYLCGGAVMVERDGEWSLYYCYGDRLGSVVAVTDKNGNVLERYAYTPWGERRDPADWTKADGRTEFLLNRGFTGHEHIDAFGLIDMGGRVYDPVLGMFLSVDPFIQAPDNWLNYNRYLYCLGNPLIYVDPSGEEWYQNNKTGYYTWFEGNASHNGYSYIGEKGSVLGEFEGHIDDILSDLKIESIYSDGFTFDIAPRDKGGLIKSSERGWDFFDEFVDGVGPEFSVILPNHPYTEALKQENTVINSQQIIKERGEFGKITNVKRNSFYPWQASLSSPMQFIGTYRYDGYSSKDGTMINNVVTDSKSCTSFFYHLPGVSNHRRSETKEFGNTYQFYIWQSRK
ncbi:MAG: FG-GAP-like repeat-containing protein [Paludibacteraceae bacterium]|nr:FG-GAP-like repeat-containing protein [Paludibacteraceae bacterium]